MTCHASPGQGVEAPLCLQKPEHTQQLHAIHVSSPAACANCPALKTTRRTASHIPLNVAQPSSAAPALPSLRVFPLFSPRGIYSGPQRIEFKPLRVAYAWLSFSVCPSWLGFLGFRSSDT